MAGGIQVKGTINSSFGDAMNSRVKSILMFIIQTAFIVTVWTVIATALAGCASTVVRDKNVYKQEIRFFQEGGERVSKVALQYAKLVAMNGDIDNCAILAKDALVVQSRFPFHAQMALYLVEMAEKPQKPKIEDATEWCKAQVEGASGEDQ